MKIEGQTDENLKDYPEPRDVLIWALVSNFHCHPNFVHHVKVGEGNRCEIMKFYKGKGTEFFYVNLWQREKAVPKGMTYTFNRDDVWEVIQNVFNKQKEANSEA